MCALLLLHPTFFHDGLQPLLATASYIAVLVSGVIGAWGGGGAGPGPCTSSDLKNNDPSGATGATIIGLTRKLSFDPM